MHLRKVTKAEAEHREATQESTSMCWGHLANIQRHQAYRHAEAAALQYPDGDQHGNLDRAS